MIDTDKYEGHTPKHWRRKYNFGQMPFNKADENLIYDAPLLLEEVKQLQKRNEWLEEVVALAQEHGAIDLSDYGWPQWEEEE